MTEPIRLLHFADLHIGMENYGQLDPSTGTLSRVRDFLDRLDEVIDYAIDHDADLVIFAGDAFKTRDPSPTYQREFAIRIKRLADSIPILLLVGNHDMPGMAAKANSVDIFKALDVPGVIVGHQSDGRVITTDRGPLYLAWVPYPMRGRLLNPDHHRGKSIDELQTALREKVSEQIQDLTLDANDQDMPRVLVGHFSVADAKFGSEQSVTLGHDSSIEQTSLSSSSWDYIAMGHLHQHQVVKTDPPIVYSGSLERIDFGEEHEDKGFCWIELQRGNTYWKFVSVSARPFKSVSVDVRQAEDPTDAVLAAVAAAAIDGTGAIVRVMIQMLASQEATLRERDISQALEPAYQFSIAREIDIETRSRSHGLSPESLTPSELVERYFKSRNVADDRLAVLLDKAADLLNNSVIETGG